MKNAVWLLDLEYKRFCSFFFPHCLGGQAQYKKAPARLQIDERPHRSGMSQVQSPQPGYQTHVWSHLRPSQPVQFSSVAQSCPTLCDPMNRSMPGLPVHHLLVPVKISSHRNDPSRQHMKKKNSPAEPSQFTVPISHCFLSHYVLEWYVNTSSINNFKWRTDLLELL